MIDLSTAYMGLTLKNPLVVSASPLCEDVGNICKMEEAGAAAVVLPSLFEEQITSESNRLDHFLSYGSDSYPESLSYFPDMSDYNLGPDEYLEHIRRVKKSVELPVIASLNGVSTGGWIRYAHLMEEAGADALELNLYDIPVNPGVSGSRLEDSYHNLVALICSAVRIPVAVKLHPFFTSIPHTAKYLEEAGAKALVLFNRFYQPDFDLEAMEIRPNLVLSSSQELLLRLHWVAILYGSIGADLGVTGGVHDGKDVLKAMMAGAKVAMMTSALLKFGIQHLRAVREEILLWMQEKEYDTIRQMQGSMSRISAGRPAVFERANYMRVLGSYHFARTRH